MLEWIGVSFVTWLFLIPYIGKKMSWKGKLKILLLISVLLGILFVNTCLGVVLIIAVGSLLFLYMIIGG